MLLRLLGLMDLAVGAVMWLHIYGIVSWRPVLAAIAYLLLKVLAFKGDFISLIDLLMAIYLALLLFYELPILTIVFTIYIVIKGVWSLI